MIMWVTGIVIIAVALGIVGGFSDRPWWFWPLVSGIVCAGYGFLLNVLGYI